MEPTSSVDSRPLSHAEQANVLCNLPGWAREQRVTDVMAVSVRVPVPDDLDDFADFVMEKAPAPVPAALTSPALSDIDPDSFMAIALFQSGAVRTVGTVAAGEKDLVQLSPFDYRSLIDPDDAALAPGADGILRLEMMMLAVAAES
jgi:hypothetical protein